MYTIYYIYNIMYKIYTAKNLAGRWQASYVSLIGIHGSSCDFTPSPKLGRGAGPTC